MVSQEKDWQYTNKNSLKYQKENFLSKTENVCWQQSRFEKGKHKRKTSDIFNLRSDSWNDCAITTVARSTNVTKVLIIFAADFLSRRQMKMI